MTAVFGVLGAAVVLLATATAVVEDGPLWKSVYLPLLDIFTMGDPATEESTARQVLQLIAGFVGLAVLPLVVAAAMNATLAFRTASANHVPDTSLHDHIVLVGLGKIGTRVLAQLCTTDHKVVVIERDPQARGSPWRVSSVCTCSLRTPPPPEYWTSPASPPASRCSSSPTTTARTSTS